MEDTLDKPLPWHWCMLNDIDRNEAYRRAIERAMRTRDDLNTALDIGCGAGLLTLLMAGGHMTAEQRDELTPPSHITACELLPCLADIAQRVWEANRVPGVVLSVTPSHSSLLPSASPGYDLVVTETVDEVLLP